MRKILLAIVLILGLLFILTGVFYLFTSRWAPVFSRSDSLPEFSDSVPIYKVVKPDIDIEYVKTLGNKLGLTGKITQGPENYLMRDEDSDANLEVYIATGTIHYLIGSKLFPKVPPVLPSDEEAKKIAMDFLREKGLLREGDVADKVSVGGTSNGVPSHQLVSFTHAIDVTGSGGKFGVRIGDHGEVIDVFVNIISFEPAETIALKPVEQAYTELVDSKRHFTSISTFWVRIKNVKLTYWLDGINKSQEYVYPVYVFSGESRGLIGNYLGGYSGYIEATNASSINFPAICNVLINNLQ
jgi:hypothetical protein